MAHIYYAKSRLSNGEHPTCKEHMEEVSALAAQYGAAFGQQLAAGLAGSVHDFGKYAKRFEGVLNGTHAGIDHAFPSAAILVGMAKKDARRYAPVIEAVNGHHDGLKDCGGEFLSYVKHSVKHDNPIRCNAGKEASLAGKAEYTEALQAFRADFPQLQFTTRAHRESIPQHAGDRLRDMLYTRMLFSCLVDADYSASAEEEAHGYLAASQNDCFCPSQLLEKLDAYVSGLRSNSHSDAGLNKLRDDLFRLCGEAGRRASGLFTLTAPTGTGKTLALLNFALHHCAAHEKKRIIIVLPFLTLAEQNADTYAKIVDHILIDHSQRDLDDDKRVFAERWSSPFIITTSVRFFEALFAQKPTDCRKLHNIADSVILFDEAQSLPPELTASTLNAVNALCEEYRCTMLFSTATQPNFHVLPEVSWKPTEINPDSRLMYNALKRTAVEWRIDADARIPLSEIAAEMAAESSVCAIVNRRDHARKLYRILREQCSEDTVCFLTTDLCPDHRRSIVNTVRQRLNANLPCRVVATQCIEAGVDLDFQVMFRALAPLDAIIQAAGRCNRNGRQNGLGRVIVFEPDESKLYPSAWYESAALLVKLLLSRSSIDIHDPRDIAAYYHALFADAHDAPNLLGAIARKDYTLTAKEYRLIKNNGAQVLAPYREQRALYERLRNEPLQSGITKRWMREASPITVSIFNSEQLALHCERLRYATKRSGVTMESDFYVLLPGHTDCYTDDMGLQFREERAEDYMI